MRDTWDPQYGLSVSRDGNVLKTARALLGVTADVVAVWIQRESLRGVNESTSGNADVYLRVRTRGLM